MLLPLKDQFFIEMLENFCPIGIFILFPRVISDLKKNLCEKLKLNFKCKQNSGSLLQEKKKLSSRSNRVVQ